MAPIPYHLALSIIVALSVIILCNSAILKEDRKQGDTSNSDDNSPRRERICDDPWGPPTTPRWCDYYVSFGNRSDGDEQGFNNKYPRNSRIIVKFPEPNTINNSPINYISVSYSRSGKFYYDDDDVVSIVEGGIGEKYATISIEPKVFYPGDYDVAFYVQPNNYKNN